MLTCRRFDWIDQCGLEESGCYGWVTWYNVLVEDLFFDVTMHNEVLDSSMVRCLGLVQWVKLIRWYFLLIMILLFDLLNLQPLVL